MILVVISVSYRNSCSILSLTPLRAIALLVYIGSWADAAVPRCYLAAFDVSTCELSVSRAMEEYLAELTGGHSHHIPVPASIPDVWCICRTW